MARRFTETFPRLAELMPPETEKEDPRERHRIEMTVRWLIGIAIAFIFQYTRLGLTTMSLALGAIAVFCVGLLGGIQRFGHARRFGEAALAGLFLLLIFSNYYSGGFYDPNFSWFLVVPVGSAVVLGHWVAIRWTVATVVVAVAFWTVEELGYPIVNQIPESERHYHALANQCSAVMAVGILMWIFVRSHTSADARAVSAQKALLKERERLRVLAHFDSLTTLPNRHTFELSLERNLNAGKPVALIYLDLSRFKDVNDAFGYAVGDALLIEVGQRFAAVVHDGPAPVHLAIERYDDGPLLARRGGDEFVIILPGATGAEAASLAQKLVRSLQTPVSVPPHRLHIAASVGIALGPTDGTTVSSLVRAADIALSRVKQRGVGGVDFYEEEALESVRRRVLIETALREAIDEGELRVLYQPLFNMEGEVVGAEALMRWDSSILGPVSPNEFIPIAERTGQMRDLGRWVLATACREASNWPDHIRVSVNVSVAQLRGAYLVDAVRDVLDVTGLPPRRLELEITESLLADDGFMRTVLGELRGLGVSLALDDFGTGFSSLGVLRQLPVDRLKVDRSFVQNMHVNDGDAALVRTIIAMGRELGLHVLAEGVELEQQFDALRELGCDEVQGYLLGRPLGSAAFRDRAARTELVSHRAPAGGESGAEDAPRETDPGRKIIPIGKS